jgi:hypothetical protein
MEDEMEITAAAPRGAHAPGKVVDALTGKSATYVSIAWDASFFARDTHAGFATSPAKDGTQQLVAAWNGADLARDHVRTDLRKGDEYQRAMVSIFADAVARNEAALAELRSNKALGEKFQPKNGTFDFVLDRPGTDHDLRYVGLIEAAPAPIKAILDAAVGFRRHF